jgi:hypothetical protein
MPDFKKHIESLKVNNNSVNQDSVDLSAVNYAGNDSLEKIQVDKTITKNYEPGREYLGGKDRNIDPNSTSPTISENNNFKTISIVVIVIISLFILRKIFNFIKK